MLGPPPLTVVGRSLKGGGVLAGAQSSPVDVSRGTSCALGRRRISPEAFAFAFARCPGMTASLGALFTLMSPHGEITQKERM